MTEKFKTATFALKPGESINFDRGQTSLEVTDKEGSREVDLPVKNCVLIIMVVRK